MSKKSKQLAVVLKDIGKNKKAGSIIDNMLKKIDEFADDIEEEINNSPFHDLFK